MTEWTFGKKLGAGFVIAALTMVVIALFGYQGTQRLIENDRWVDHSRQVRRDIADLSAHMKDAETGQRGYIITGNEAFLEPYVTASHEVDKVFADLRRHSADNPEHQTRLDVLRPLMDAKLSELKSTIDTRRTQGFEATVKVVNAGDGKRSMDQIRRILSEMDKREMDLLQQRRVEAEESAHTARAVILWGTVAGVIFIAAVGAFLAQSLSRQVTSAVLQIEGSSTELQSASKQQSSGAREQAGAMSEISTTIRELLVTSRQIAESAQRVASVAEQTAALARSGDATVELGQESIAVIRRQVDVIVTHMLELGKKSQQIGSVLEIVSELAEQTNILAINATIEAAGAGDAGKRFAVVADEIRKLADRVAASTKEIQGLIDDVRGAVNTTVMTTETGSKTVDVGTRQFGDIAASFKQISAQVAMTTEAAREIGLSTKQQATAVEQVNVAITNVAQATKETEVSTVQTLRTASELASLSRQLLQLVQPQQDPRPPVSAPG